MIEQQAARATVDGERENSAARQLMQSVDGCPGAKRGNKRSLGSSGWCLGRIRTGPWSEGEKMKMMPKL
jgi:hypothetical protein